MTKPKCPYNIEMSSLNDLAMDGESQIGVESNSRILPADSAFPAPVEAPISRGQRALWLLQQRSPESSAYNLAYAVQMSGQLDFPAFQRAFEKLVRRHEALRTTFIERNGEPVRLIHNTMESCVAFEDAEDWDEEALHERLNAEVHRPFDMARGPLVRVLVLKRSSEKWVVLLAIHHIITDLWSFTILVDEWGALYRQEITGNPANLRRLRAHYADYVSEQEEMLSGREGEALWHYWRDQLAGELHPLDLPTDYPRPSKQTCRGAAHSLVLDAGLTQALRTLSQAQGVPLYATLLAAFQTLLHRYTGQEDIIVGSPKAGRRPRFGRVIGYFVNPVALRTSFVGDPSFLDLLAQVQRTVTEAFAHDQYPFSLLVERLQRSTDFARTPVFQVMFAWQKTARMTNNPSLASFTMNQSGERLKFGDLPMEVLPLDQRAVPFELSCSISEMDKELGILLEYNTDLFEAQTIIKLLSHFESLLRGIVSDPQCPVSALPLMTEEERRTLLYDWNNFQGDALVNPVEAVADWQISAFIEARARQMPDALAVHCGASTLTYGDLEYWANQLAHYLQTLGVGPGSRVGLFMERSVEMIAGVLGILKAGATYLPLDPAYPQKRTDFILRDAQVVAVVTQKRLIEQLAVHSVQAICIDDVSVVAQQPNEPFHCPAVSSDAAYIIYTSGSTGQPKGVLVSYGAITNHCRDMVEYYHLTPKDRVLQFASLDFDASLEQILPTLMAGARLILRDETIWTPVEFFRKVREYALTVIDIPPGYWHQLAASWTPDFGEEGLAQLRLVIVGGDVMRPQTLPLWQRTPMGKARLLNAYGPTEATITAITYEVPPKYKPLCGIPIGRPLLNRRAYILDSYQQPVPVGIPGELYLGGAGVAIGYLNRPELTAECFVPNSFAEGERLYKTGDLVRYLHNGTIEFLGRADRQVKIRGFRIELDEIESALCQHPRVREAAVVAWEDTPGDMQLVGYVVLKGNGIAEFDALISFLKTQLPLHMVPTIFVKLDALPMSAGGVKVDHQALPAPTYQRAELKATYTPPTTLVEKKLVDIWSQVLGVHQIGIQDDFFALGGDSLQAGQVASRLWQAFKIELPLRELFDRPTLADLAAQIEVQRSRTISVKDANGEDSVFSIPPLTHRDLDEPIPLSFAQERIWFLHQVAPESSAYNVAEAMRLDGRLNYEALQYALAEIVLRHASLRSVFPAKDGEPMQVIRTTVDVSLQIVDLRSSPLSERSERAQQLANEVAQRPFDLRKGVLVRFSLFQLEDERHILVLNFHHMVADARSLGVLVIEISQLYNSYVFGAPVHLPELPIQYTDFAVWQREWLRGGILDTHMNYWQEKLAGVPVLAMPTDYPRPVVQSYRGKVDVYKIPEDLLARIRDFSYHEGVSLAMTLLAVFDVLLYRYTGQDDIAVGMPIANRTHRDIEDIVGTFVNTLIMRTDLSGDPTFRELLIRVRDTALDAYAHQDLPYAKLVAEMQPTRDASRTPLIQVMFSVINVVIPKMDMTGLTVTPYVVDWGGAQFDITLTVVDTESVRAVYLEYSTDLFAPATIERLYRHYINLLKGIVDNPDQRILALPLLTAAECHQIVKVWNDTEAKFPCDMCVHQLVEAQVHRSPDAVALSFEGSTVTYRELDARANRLAHYLQRRGVGPDTLVGLHIARSTEMVVGLLGILKAGGCYLPLDPSYPPDRLAFMMEDAGLRLLLTTAQGSRELPLESCQVVCLDRDWPAIAAESAEICTSSVTSDNLAYVIYTSGSTGKPKGVLIPHRAVVNFLWSMKTEPGLTEEDVLLSVTSLSFDIAVLELLLPLIVGARVELASEAVAVDGFRLSQALGDAGVTVMQATPTTWRMLLASGWQGRAGLKSLCGGEPLDPSLANALSQRSDSLWNMYGPTETTVWSSLSRIVDHQKITIGRPINNTQMYVLDSAMQPVPVGVQGDLYIGGLGLAYGYLNRPDLTAARFVPSPFDPRAKGLLYRTGDLARCLATGEIEILGRLDSQVKLRGHRIELGEIEAVLLGHPDVIQAAVLVSEDKDEMLKHLIAYLVLHEDTELSIKALRAFIREKLPVYMLPAAFAYVDTMPLTPNGKVDRKALTHFSGEEVHDQSGYIPPRDFVEQRLAKIWEHVLDLRLIGVRDNFFDLGGHSLLAVRLFSQIETQLGIKLPVVTLFQSPTIEQLGNVVKHNEKALGWDSLVPINTKGSRLPFFCVHGIGGGVLDYAGLAKLLGTEQPFYALQARGMDGVVPPHHRIEDMARYYIEGMKAVQPEGPYALGGYSFGGVVAFEMACQLYGMGEQVALLALLETYAPGVSNRSWTPKAILRFLCNLPRWGWDIIRRSGGWARLLGSFSLPMRKLMFRRESYALEAQEKRQELEQAHWAALTAYKPRIYPGEVTLFRVPGMILRQAQDPLFGWGKIAAGGVTVKMIHGAHYNILEKPQVSILADQLRASLIDAHHKGRASSSS